MHGVMFHELRKYATARFGDDAWPMLLQRANLEGKMYLATETYPDEEIVSLVTHASAVTGREIPALLSDFGEFLVPDLLQMFRTLVRPEWRTLDVLENTEGAIHKIVRLQVRDAAPPRLHTERVARGHLRLTYTSPRRLCFVATGIITGLAKHFGEKVNIVETTCMARGNAQCVIDVKQ